MAIVWFFLIFYYDVLFFLLIWYVCKSPWAFHFRRINILKEKSINPWGAYRFQSILSYSTEDASTSRKPCISRGAHCMTLCIKASVVQNATKEIKKLDGSKVSETALCFEAPHKPPGSLDNDETHWQWRSALQSLPPPITAFHLPITCLHYCSFSALPLSFPYANGTQTTGSWCPHSLFMRSQTAVPKSRKISPPCWISCDSRGGHPNLARFGCLHLKSCMIQPRWWHLEGKVGRVNRDMPQPSCEHSEIPRASVSSNCGSEAH